MTEDFRYAAFISYAHADETWARWIHRKLEGFKPPRGMASKGQPYPFRPVFRDRDELSASTQLGEILRAALTASATLIVICSPRSAASHWVNEEIRFFRRHHGIEKIYALIVDGEPYAADGTNCFPPALLEPEHDGGAPLEPLAADARAEGDGKRATFLKIAAGLLGARLDQLVRRDAARRQRRLVAISAASTTGMVLAGALSLYANAQRIEAVAQRRFAERQERSARATTDYLIDTFRIANPATENADTITALTILRRGTDGIGTDLAGEPLIQAELYGAVGQIYTNLRQLEEAEITLDLGYALLDPETDEAVLNRLKYTSVLFYKAKLDDALAAANSVLAQLEGSPSADPAVLSEAYEIRGYIYRDRIEFDAALADLDRARTLLAEVSPLDEEAAANIDSVRGLILFETDKYEESRQILTDVLRRQEKRFTPNHYRVGVAHQNLAELEVRSGNLDAARSHLDRALAIFSNVLSSPHPDLAKLNILRGQISSDLGDTAGAIASFEAAAAQFEQLYPEGHYLTGYAYVYLALALSDIGEFDRALTLLDDAIPQYRASYGDTNADFGDLAVHRGVILARAGRRLEAQAACEEGIDILNATLGEGSPITADLRAWCVAEGALKAENENP